MEKRIFKAVRTLLTNKIGVSLIATSMISAVMTFAVLKFVEHSNFIKVSSFSAKRVSNETAASSVLAYANALILERKCLDLVQLRDLDDECEWDSEGNFARLVLPSFTAAKIEEAVPEYSNLKLKELDFTVSMTDISSNHVLSKIVKSIRVSKKQENEADDGPTEEELAEDGPSSADIITKVRFHYIVDGGNNPQKTDNDESQFEVLVRIYLFDQDNFVRYEGELYGLYSPFMVNNYALAVNRDLYIGKNLLSPDEEVDNGRILNVLGLPAPTRNESGLRFHSPVYVNRNFVIPEAEDTKSDIKPMIQFLSPIFIGQSLQTYKGTSVSNFSPDGKTNLLSEYSGYEGIKGGVVRENYSEAMEIMFSKSSEALSNDEVQFFRDACFPYSDRLVNQSIQAQSKLVIRTHPDVARNKNAFRLGLTELNEFIEFEFTLPTTTNDSNHLVRTPDIISESILFFSLEHRTFKSDDPEYLYDKGYYNIFNEIAKHTSGQNTFFPTARNMGLSIVSPTTPPIKADADEATTNAADYLYNIPSSGPLKKYKYVNPPEALENYAVNEKGIRRRALPSDLSEALFSEFISTEGTLVVGLSNGEYKEFFRALEKVYSPIKIKNIDEIHETNPQLYFKGTYTDNPSDQTPIQVGVGVGPDKKAQIDITHLIGYTASYLKDDVHEIMKNRHAEYGEKLREEQVAYDKEFAEKNAANVTAITTLRNDAANLESEADTIERDALTEVKERVLYPAIQKAKDDFKDAMGDNSNGEKKAHKEKIDDAKKKMNEELENIGMPQAELDAVKLLANQSYVDLVENDADRMHDSILKAVDSLVITGNEDVKTDRARRELEREIEDRLGLVNFIRAFRDAVGNRRPTKNTITAEVVDSDQGEEASEIIRDGFADELREITNNPYQKVLVEKRKTMIKEIIKAIQDMQDDSTYSDRLADAANKRKEAQDKTTEADNNSGVDIGPRPEHLPESDSDGLDYSRFLSIKTLQSKYYLQVSAESIDNAVPKDSGNYVRAPSVVDVEVKLVDQNGNQTSLPEGFFFYQLPVLNLDMAITMATAKNTKSDYLNSYESITDRNEREDALDLILEMGPNFYKPEQYLARRIYLKPKMAGDQVMGLELDFKGYTESNANRNWRFMDGHSNTYSADNTSTDYKPTFTKEASGELNLSNEELRSLLDFTKMDPDKTYPLNDDKDRPISYAGYCGEGISEPKYISVGNDYTEGSFHSWNFKPLSKRFQYDPRSIGRSGSATSIWEMLYKPTTTSEKLPNSIIIGDHNQELFHTYSIIDLCTIKPEAEIVMGFFTCRRLKVEQRNDPLIMLGTFIVDQLEIHSSAIQNGIDWMSIHHPKATELLQDQDVIETDICKSKPDTPIWKDDAPGDTLEAIRNCDSATLIKRADPFRWTSFTPECGLAGPTSPTECAPSGIYKRLSFYKLSEKFWLKTYEQKQAEE
ncbi:MAG: hypothetical protein ACPGJV_03580 [Bacteriovoracaceae bacterium]